MGSTDIAMVLALGETWFRVPETFKIVISGTPPERVYSKDLALHLIGMIGASGANYKALEFCGDTVDNMSMSQRLTMANMSIEAGAKAGLFNADKITQEYLIKQGRSEDYRPISPDVDAVYQRIIEIDASKLEPLVAKPHSVDNVAPARELKGTRIDQVSIGTCTNGRLEDLAIAAGILKGKRHHPRTRVIVAPPSKQVLLDAIKAGYIQVLVEAGAAVVSPGCASCSGNHEGLLGDGESCMSTANRNFKGRMGSPEAFVYLGNPATVAATAIAGEITDPREVM
jgi:3-isopropylmalate/(R)-2-methylmalate dehydratase large subunit